MEGKSTLNPYARSYIPLSEGEKDERSKTGSPEKSEFSHNTAFAEPSSSGSLEDKKSSLAGLCESDYNVEEPPDSDDWELVNSPPYEQDSQEESEVNYLASIFTNFSLESLRDVYDANAGDVHDSMRMLLELEAPADFSRPQEMNFHDAPEYRTPDQATTCALPGETSGSTSGHEG